MTRKDEDKTHSELLAQARRLRERQGFDARDEQDERELVDFGAGLPGFIVRPLRWMVRRLGFFFGWYWRLVRHLHKRFSAGKPLRSLVSGVVLTGVSLALGWFLIFRALPLAGEIAYDAVLVEVFAAEDVSVFSKPDWVEGQPGVLNVFSCRQYPCEAQTDSVEYRIRDSLYLDIKRILTRLEPHDPGELAGAFLSEENACRYRTYGRRIKLLGLYPHLVSATCRPVNGDNAAALIEELRG